jgi:hypothetical protein
LSVIDVYTPEGTLSVLAQLPLVVVDQTEAVPEKLGNGVGAAA